MLWPKVQETEIRRIYEVSSFVKVENIGSSDFRAGKSYSISHISTQSGRCQGPALGKFVSAITFQGFSLSWPRLRYAASFGAYTTKSSTKNSWS